MVAVKNLLLFAASALAAVVPRDFTTIQNDLSGIDSKVNTLTSAVNSYNGGEAAAIPIANDESSLESAIKSATTDAQNSSPVTSSQAQTVINYINNTLEPDISSSVTAIINKKTQFVAAGLGSTIKNDFANLQTETQNYGNALLALAPSAQQSAGQTALNNVLAQLQRGANAYADQ